MSVLDVMRKRRSIRKYQDKQISEKELQIILEAGVLAPNAGGEQRNMIVAVHNKELTEKIGQLNISRFDYNKLNFHYVSEEQPSLIDDPSIKNGFYGAPTVCVIFGRKHYTHSAPDAFCMAENMCLVATELEIGSCIISRAKDTFDNEEGKELLEEWKIADNMEAQCFVILGYLDGDYPKEKKIREGRVKIVSH